MKTCVKCNGPHNYDKNQVDDKLYFGSSNWKFRLLDRMVNSKRGKKQTPIYKTVKGDELCYDCFLELFYSRNRT